MVDMEEEEEEEEEQEADTRTHTAAEDSTATHMQHLERRQEHTDTLMEECRVTGTESE